MKLTCICQEEGYDDILIYTVTADPQNYEALCSAIKAERQLDLGADEAGDVTVLFAFEGDISPCCDWRD